MISLLEGVLITPLKEIFTPGGNVFHGMKATDPGYVGFGEAYFSKVESNNIKPWKRHRQMTLNLIVPLGSIRFVLFDDRLNSSTNGLFQELILSPENYFRLTVPPMIWVAFQGGPDVGGILLNVANIPHIQNESDRKILSEILYDW